MLLRERLGFPLIITSAYRSPEHNAAVGGRTGSAHLAGRAVDVAVYGQEAHALVRWAMLLGFTGIGVSQRGEREKRFVHLDDLPPSPGTPRPWIWTY